MSGPGGRAANILLAKVLNTKMKKVAKCEIYRLKLDSYVMKYYNKRRTIFARDEDRLAKDGDVVLLKELPAKVSERVAFKVDRIVFSLGNVTDPISGLRCDKDGYWESRPGEWEERMAEKLPERTEGEADSKHEGTAV